MSPSARHEWHSLPPSWDLAPRCEARTGDDGRCTLTGLAAGLWSVAVEEPGRVRRSVAVMLGTGALAVDVELRSEAGHVFSGRVLNDDGRPIANAVVVATYPEIAPGGRCARSESPDFALVRSGADGGYRFDALPSTTVGVWCGPPGAWSSHRWPVLVPSVTSLDLRMTEGGAVEGTVRAEPDGSPVAGAEVTFALSTWHRARVFAHVRTDARGKYRIDRFPGFAVNDISVTAAGYWSHPTVLRGRRPPVRLETDAPNVFDLSLRPDTPEFAAVRGVVRGPGGPVAGASVSLLERGGGTWYSKSRETDAEGRFHFMEAPPVRIAVVVNEAPGHYQAGMKHVRSDGGEQLDPAGPWWIAPDAPRPVTINVTLRRGGRVTGRVLHVDGTPAGDALVYALGARATSNADGTFVLDALSEPETTTVSARTRDGELVGESAAMEIGDGKDADRVEIRLKPDDGSGRPHRIEITGKVHAERVAPLRDAVVSFQGEWVPVEPSGAFRIAAEVYGRWNEIPIGVEVPGWGRTVVNVPLAEGAASADAGTIEVPRAALLSGRVMGPDGPLAGATISLGHRRASSGCSLDEGPQPVIVAVTSADGSYAATGVPGGTFNAHAIAAGHIEEETDFELTPASGDEPEPEEWSAKLSREAWLRGRLARKDGRGVPGAQLWASRGGGDRWNRDTVHERSEADGTFAMRVRDGVPYVITAEPQPDYERDWAERDGLDVLPEGESAFREFASKPLVAGGAPVELVVEDGAEISGVVLDVEGRPMADLAIECKRSSPAVGLPEQKPERDDSGDESGEPAEPAAGAGEPEPRFHVEETTTDANGAFTLRALPDGSFDITAEAGLDGRLVERSVQAGRRDVHFRFTGRTVIEGVLLGGDGAPAPGRWLVATRVSSRDDERSDDRTTAKTDESGGFRLVGCGDRPCRVELVNADRTWDPMNATWPLRGGAPVEPGARDLVLRIPARDETRIRGRIVDAGGKRFGGCTVLVRRGSGASVQYSPGVSGTEIDESGLRLDELCVIEVTCGGPTWFLEVPAGTSDLLITAENDGVKRVEFGGRVITSPPVGLIDD